MPWSGEQKCPKGKQGGSYQEQADGCCTANSTHVRDPQPHQKRTLSWFQCLFRLQTPSQIITLSFFIPSFNKFLLSPCMYQPLY